MKAKSFDELAKGFNIDKTGEGFLIEDADAILTGYNLTGKLVTVEERKLLAGRVAHYLLQVADTLNQEVEAQTGTARIADSPEGLSDAPAFPVRVNSQPGALWNPIDCDPLADVLRVRELARRQSMNIHGTVDVAELQVPGFKPPIVCLIGSTRFREGYRRLNAMFTFQGFVVLSCGSFQGDPEAGYAPKGYLDHLHKRKIDLADLIVCINPGDYIGESTKSEIEYAVASGKCVMFSEQFPGWGIKSDIETTIQPKS